MNKVLKKIGIRELITGATSLEEIKDLRQEAASFEQLSYKTARAIQRTAEKQIRKLEDIERFNKGAK